jgi:phosphonate transport system substrate-binding protein
MRRLFACIAAAMLAACAGASEERAASADAAPVKFSAIPDQNTTELQEKFKPLEAYLTAILGVPVRFVPARDYQASVEMFVNGDIDLAWYGGLTGVQARNKVPGARARATCRWW